MPNKGQKKKRFTFNDPTVKNSHGFLIPTEGIGLERFAKNPVMLDSHWNNNHSVIGRWEAFENKEGLLSGLPVFDVDDENAAKIAGKVERDFIRGCSMGITFNHADLKYVAGQLILEKCELYEVSIVAVPSNANSIHLYHQDGKTLMTDEEVQKLCLSATPTEPEKEFTTPKNPENENMSKIKLTAVAALILGFTADTEMESAELSAKIVGLDAEKKAAELKLSAKLEAEEASKLTAVNLQVDNAVTAGQISAEKKDQFVNLGIANPELLTSTLASIPVKKTFAATIKNTDGTESEVKTAEDFQKLSLEAQLSFKSTQPDQYKKLFTINN